MKKLFLMVPALALILASCGGGSDGNKTVDPLTLSFTGTGTANWASTTPVNLTSIFRDGTTQTIGILNPDKSVKITITPSQVAKFNPLPLANYKNNFDGCDTSNLSATQGASYYRFHKAEFTSNGTDSYIIPISIVRNADGTFNAAEQQFWYLDKPSSLTGTIKCTNDLQNYSLILKPGWNHVVNTYTYNPTTQSVTNDNFTVVDYSNTYNGSWVVDDY